MKLPTTNLIAMEGQAPACPPQRSVGPRGHAGACPSSAFAMVMSVLALALLLQTTAAADRPNVLFAKLDELGLRENTIVVFQSDNGHSTEERAHFGGGSAGSNRGAKFSLFEGGIRLPAILSWPGRIPVGEFRDQIAHACDWMPTLAELCGVPLPDKTLDGLSLAKVLADGAAPSPHDGKSLHWQVGEGPKADWAVREGEWKLIGKSRDTTDGHSKEILENFLVNLAEDPGETTNRAAAHPDIVARLRKIHESPLE